VTGFCVVCGGQGCEEGLELLLYQEGGQPFGLLGAEGMNGVFLQALLEHLPV